MSYKKSTSSQKHTYGTFDGLRSLACVGVIMFHMWGNNSYGIHAYWYDGIIGHFGDFVFLFMVLSAFGMCNGYLDQVANGFITPLEFYKKRYLRILPYFSFLVLLDVILNYQDSTIPEAIADVTLLYGLFPNQIEVIGVGWFLGLLFAFYFIFPFYTILVGNRKSAWLAFGISLVLNYYGGNYFGLDRRNIVFSLCFFMEGGLIYLYREEIKRISPVLASLVVVGSTVLYFTVGARTSTQLLVSGSILVFAVIIDDCKWKPMLDNRLFTFVGSISLEVYLSNMLVFRGIERAGINTLIQNPIAQYFVTVAVSLTGTILFVLTIKGLVKQAYGVLSKKEKSDGTK